MSLTANPTRATLDKPVVQFQASLSSPRYHPLLADSGSDVSLIPPSFLDGVDPQHILPPPTTGPFLGAKGIPLNISGSFSGHFWVHNRLIPHTFYVCNDLKTCGLLGRDAFRAHHLVYNGASNTIEFLSHPATLTHDTHMLPMSTTRVTARCATNGLSVAAVSVDDCLNIEPMDCLVHPLSNEFEIMLVNNSALPLLLPRHTHIAEIFNIHQDNLERLSPDHLTKPQLPSHLPPDDNNNVPDNRTKETFIRHHLNLEHLPCSIADAYVSIFQQNFDAVSLHDWDFGTYPNYEMQIELSDTSPVYTRQFQMPEMHRKELLRHVTAWIRYGLIERSDSSFQSPIFLVRKKPTKPLPFNSRPVIDFRQLNKKLKRPQYRLPLISEQLLEVAKSRPSLFSSLDLRSAFYSIRVKPKHRPYTAFHIPNMGQYQFTRMPMGLASSPSLYQFLASRAFREPLDQGHCLQYLDDILILGNHSNMIARLQQILTCCIASGFKINLTKCSIAVPQVEFLGYHISSSGLQPGSSKSAALLAARCPSTTSSIKSFYGLASFFRAFIPNFAVRAEPLLALTTKQNSYHGGPLPPTALQAFHDLRTSLSHSPCLTFPNFQKRFFVYTDASLGSVADLSPLKGGIAGVLLQFHDDITRTRPQAVAYCSRPLTTSESNYSTTMVELLAITYSIEQFDVYLSGSQFTIITDHRPLAAAEAKPIQKRTINRLQDKLLEYDMTIEYTSGHLQIADFLSRFPDHTTSVATITMFRDTSTALPSNEILSIGSDANPDHHVPRNPQPATVSPLDTLHRLQTLDPLCCAISTYLKTNQIVFPQQKQQIIRLAKLCTLSPRTKLLLINHCVDNLRRRLIIAPVAAQGEILAAAHCNPVAGHGRYASTIDKILQTYFWPNMSADTQNFIDNCDLCIKSSNQSKFRNVPIHPLPQATKCFSDLTTDTFGPVRSSNGTRHILTITCNFSRFTRFIAVPAIDAQTVAIAFLNNFICLFGIPNIVRSDLGKNYVASIMQTLSRYLGVFWHFPTAYSPTTQASAEIKNKKIVRYLRLFTDQRPLDWEQHLPQLELSYNTARNAATKLSPFEIVFGQTCRTPYNQPDLLDNGLYDESFAGAEMQKFRTIRALALANSLNYKLTYKTQFDNTMVRPSKSQPQTFNPGNIVYLFSPGRKKVCKWEHMFRGPFVVLAIKPPTTVYLQDVKTRRRKTAHISKLRLSSLSQTPDSHTSTPHDIITPRLTDQDRSHVTSKGFPLNPCESPSPVSGGSNGPINQRTEKVSKHLQTARALTDTVSSPGVGQSRPLARDIDTTTAAWLHSNRRARLELLPLGDTRLFLDPSEWPNLPPVAEQKKKQKCARALPPPPAAELLDVRYKTEAAGIDHSVELHPAMDIDTTEEPLPPPVNEPPPTPPPSAQPTGLGQPWLDLPELTLPQPVLPPPSQQPQGILEAAAAALPPFRNTRSAVRRGAATPPKSLWRKN